MPDMLEMQPYCIRMLAEDSSYTIARSAKVHPGTQKPHPMAVCIEPETTEKACQAAACIAHNMVSTVDGRPEVKLACESTLSVLQLCLDQAKVHQAGMPVARGRAFEKNVSVLRDTWCSSIVVKRSLVNNCNLKGKECMAVLIDGTVRRFPIAVIHVDTPYYTGDVEPMCMERTIYDLIIGNIQDPEAHKNHTRNGTKNTVELWK